MSFILIFKIVFGTWRNGCPGLAGINANFSCNFPSLNVLYNIINHYVSCIANIFSQYLLRKIF